MKPAVLQIELHPHAWPTYLPTLVPLAQQHNIRLQPVSALVPLIYKAGGAVETQVKSVAEERNRKEDPAQILLMWAQQITEGSVVTYVVVGAVECTADRNVSERRKSPIKLRLCSNPSSWRAMYRLDLELIWTRLQLRDQRNRSGNGRRIGRI